MENFCLLVINPGSTSTKVALYNGEVLNHEKNLEHSAEELAKFKTMDEQFGFRKDAILEYLKELGVPLTALSGIASRGGVLGQLETGAYLIDKPFLKALKDMNIFHPANISPGIAYEIAQEANVDAYCYDLVCGTGKPEPLYTVSGIPQIKRPFETHVLNSRAVCFEQAKRDKTEITNQNYIVAHLGGGITTNLVEKGVIRDLVADDEGTFSPERSGGLPCKQLIKMCFSGKFTQDEVSKLVKGKGGLTAYLGSNDLREVETWIKEGDETAELVYNAMVLQIAKNIASLSVVVYGKVDKIILTGGMAYSEKFSNAIKERVAHIAEVSIIPGAFEMEALAKGITRVINGEEIANTFIK